MALKLSIAKTQHIGPGVGSFYKIMGFLHSVNRIKWVYIVDNLWNMRV